MSLTTALALDADRERSVAGSATWLSELTRAIRAGDEPAFSQFYDLYHLRLYQQALLLSKGDEQEAREVLQSVVLKLARKFQVFDDEKRFWAWLCRCLQNAYVDLCRGRRRDKKLVPLDELSAELPNLESPRDPWSDALGRAMAQFAPDEQELLRAAYEDERPLQELADGSGQSYKAVESRLGRLRQKLKTRLLSQLRNE
jgi:RNA polymerase sigma-70 factor (ECF subfamily)